VVEKPIVIGKHINFTFRRANLNMTHV